MSNNLISVTEITQKGKTVKLTKSACYVLGKNHKMIAKATKVISQIMRQLVWLRKQTRSNIYGTNSLGIKD